MGAVCKTVGVVLRRFESFTCHSRGGRPELKKPYTGWVQGFFAFRAPVVPTFPSAGPACWYDVPMTTR